MHFARALTRNPLARAIVISLLLHAAVLFLKIASPAGPSGAGGSPPNGTGELRSSLSITLAQPIAPNKSAPPAPHVQAPPKPKIRNDADSWVKEAAPKILSAPVGPWTARTWSSAERAEMEKFLNEPPSPARPPSGGELSQRAMAMARQLGRATAEEGKDEPSVQPKAKGKGIDPFSLEIYFDAFVRKMNRSAAFVKNDPHTHGSRKALVEISLNPDGSLKSYRVLRSADQQAEIAYIKSVIDRAAPFSAFPPDIRDGLDGLSIMMCILPARSGEGGGFSRSFGGQDCRD